jgi:hypothetical protein
MAVVQATIKASLVELYNSAKENAMTEADFADGMATIIREAILSAQVTGTATGAMAGGPGVPVTGGLT